MTPQSTMEAYRLVERGEGAYREVPIPDPSAGEVRLQVEGAGLCGTDVDILEREDDYWPEPPFTLGHEVAGTVDEVGPNVTEFEEGDNVMLSGINFCGRCDKCIRGRHNECRNLTLESYGTGFDGGLAEYMVAEAQHLVGGWDMDPVRAAPLADAGVTSYSSVKKVLPGLNPGDTAAVIGVGGLGTYAIQYLRELSGAEIVALDVEQDRLKTAQQFGADHTVISDENAGTEVLELTDGNGAEAVLDFVGNTPTLETGLEMLSKGGELVVTGIGGGEVGVGWSTLPSNAQIQQNHGFTLADISDVLKMAEAGKIEIEYTEYPFDQLEEGLKAVEEATVEGRAVVTFE